MGRISRPQRLLLPILCYAGTALAAATTNVVDWNAYEHGGLGPYPQITFETSGMSVPVINVHRWNESCDPGYTLLTPHGNRIRSNRALMFDTAGQLVWHHEERGSIKNLQVQTYKGNDYLTFWIGDDGFYGHGRGYYKMVDQTYTHTHTISGLESIEGDYHEFSITPNDTALITAYQKVPWDLTFKGRDNGYIWDCVFQEIDIENDKVIFEWRASEHFTIAEMAVDSWAEWTGQEWDPWDWFHINSVEKDIYGNYLISARYTNAISYIDGRTGGFIWHLGGPHNAFIDLSERNATAFIDPHMARFVDDSTSSPDPTRRSITVFDNIDFWTLDLPEKQSRGVKIALNTGRDKPVAKATALFRHPEGIVAQAEGSLQHLPNGNFFVGYGSAPVYAEFNATGHFVCGAHYAPMSVDPGRETADVQNYRIYKNRWTGRPQQLLDVKFKPNSDASLSMYWSWNGATEVRSWQLEGKGGRSGSNKWKHLTSIARIGFETSFDLTGQEYARYRVTAWSDDRTTIGAWTVEEATRLVREIMIDSPSQTQSRFFSNSLFYLAVFGSVALLFLVNRRPFDPMQAKAASKLAD